MCQAQFSPFRSVAFLRCENLAGDEANIQLTTGRDREIAGLILLFRSKLSSKGTSSRNFTAIRGRFVLGTARVKALGWLKKERRKGR